MRCRGLVKVLGLKGLLKKSFCREISRRDKAYLALIPPSAGEESNSFNKLENRDSSPARGGVRMTL